MESIRRAASLFRSGSHNEANAALEETQRIGSPQIVEIGTQLLREPLQQDACYVQFFAARVVRSAVIRDWGSYWKALSNDILGFAANFLTCNAAELVLPSNKPLLSEMATMWAVVWKLQCAEDDNMQCLKGLKQAVSGLMHLADTSANDAPMRSIVRIVLIHLIEEFGLYQAQSHARVLALAAHERCRRCFKDSILFPLSEHAFEWGLQMTNENEKSAACLVQLWHAILCWNFSNTSIGAQSSTADRIPDALCCEGEEWQRLFGVGLCSSASPSGTTTSVLEILSSWLQAFRHGSADQASFHLLLQCVVQLASLTAVEWPLHIRLMHFERCSAFLFQFIQSSSDLNTLGVCCASLHRLVSSIGCVECVFAHERVCDVLIKPLCALTVTVIDVSHAASNDRSDDELRIEALDHLLKTWLELMTKAFADVSVLVGLPKSLEEGLSSSAAHIFQTFVGAKLNECARAMTATAVDDGTVESSFSKEYSESQTQLLALLGREQPAVTANFLLATLQQLAEQCCVRLQHRQSCPESLSEALWFVMSVSAHFIADGCESERNAIPNSIVSLAVRWERQYPDDLQSQEQSNEVLSLVRLVMKFASDVLPSLTSGLVSPGVSQAILLFLRHLCGAYLFPDDSLVFDLSTVFSSAFDSGVHVGDCALQVVVGCLMAFPFDQEVTQAATSLLAALTEKPPQFGEWVSAQHSFGLLVQLASGSVSGCDLPGITKGHIFGFAVSVCPIPTVTATVVTPIAESLGRVIHRAASTATGQLLDVNSVVSAVDSLAGAFTALRTEDQTKTVFVSLAALVDASAVIVQHHAAHKPLLTSILRMMNTIVVSCSFLASSSFVHVVQIGLVCIQVTKAAMDESRGNAARLSKEAASLEEDERVDVLSAAATFVESVATWGLLDMNCDDGFDLQGSSGPEMIAELSVQGLLVVLTFCDAHVLAIPQLRDTVFNLLQEVSSTYKARFLSASPDEANALLAATDFALASSVPALNRSGYKVMESIGTYCFQNNIQGFALLEQFALSVSNVLATAEVDSSVFSSVASALFALGGAMGSEKVLSVIYGVFSKSQTLARPFELLQKLLRSTNFGTHSRELKNKFIRDVEAVLLVVRGTKLA